VLLSHIETIANDLFHVVLNVNNVSVELSVVVVGIVRIVVVDVVRIVVVDVVVVDISFEIY